MTSTPRHLLYVSTTLPSPGFGSSVIIYRHLRRLRDWKISIVAYEQADLTRPQLNEPWQVVTIPESRWWWPPVIDRIPGSLRMRIHLLASLFKRELGPDRPAAILNQFGKNSLLALILSKAWKVPLSLIIHDRWEVWVKSGTEHKAMSRLWARHILNHAARIWPVSQELADFYSLNDPTRVSILPPIPEGNSDGYPRWNDAFGSDPVIAFAGSFHSHQLSHFRRVAHALRKIHGSLLIITRKNEFIRSELQEYSNIIYREPFAENAELIRFLKNNASCALIPSSFDSDLTKRPWDRTNFPSKLVEYVHLGLPLIIVAAPDTALGHWARRHGWYGYLDSPDSASIAALVERLTDHRLWSTMAEQSREVASSEFNPDVIHSRFESELASADAQDLKG